MRPKSKRAKAACLLGDWLHGQGIRNHGVAHDVGRVKENRLTAYLFREEDRGKVPARFAGFPVDVEVGDPLAGQDGFSLGE